MGMGNGKGELLEMLLAGGSFPAPEARGAEAQSICQQPGLACSCLHFDPGLHHHSALGPADEDMTPMHMTMFGAWYGGVGG